MDILITAQSLMGQNLTDELVNLLMLIVRRFLVFFLGPVLIYAHPINLPQSNRATILLTKVKNCVKYDYHIINGDE